MKHISWRILAVMMALLMIVGMAACGGGNDASSTPESFAETSESEEAGEEVSAPESSEPESSEPEFSEPVSSEPDVSEPTETDEDETTTTKKNPTTTKKDPTTTKKNPTTTKKDPLTVTRVTTTTTKPTTTTATTGKKPAKAKSWAEVKAMIPAGASGKTVVIREWGDPNAAAVKVNTAFEKETGIKIKHEKTNYDIFFSKLSAEVSAKNAPDVVRTQNPKQRELVYLQPMNKATSFDFTDRAWDKTLIDTWTFNGNIYAVNMVGSPVYSPYMVFYNSNLIEQYNFDDPYNLWKKGEWTWEKMLDMCEEFLDEVDDASYSGFTHMAGMEYFAAWGINPIEYNKTTGQFKCNFQDTNFLKAAQAYAKICDDGLRDKQLSNNAKFGGGKILFAILNGVSANKGGTDMSALRKQGALCCVPLPALKKGMDDVQVNGEALGYGIPKTAKNAELVPFYLRYLLDKTNYDMENYYDAQHAAESIAYIIKKGAQLNTASMVMSKELSGYPPNVLLDELKGAGVEQVKKVLDAMTPATEAAVKECNKFYAQL